jgi:hypothetical protein
MEETKYRTNRHTNLKKSTYGSSKKPRFRFNGLRINQPSVNQPVMTLGNIIEATEPNYRDTIPRGPVTYRPDNYTTRTTFNMDRLDYDGDFIPSGANPGVYYR